MDNAYYNIKELAQQKGVSINEMLQAVSISSGTFSDYKNNRTQRLSVKNLNKIAAYFNVPPEQLHQEPPQKNPPAGAEGESKELTELIQLYEQAPEALRAAALQVLKCAEPPATTGDSGAADE